MATGADWILFTSASTAEHFHGRYPLPAMLEKFPNLKLISIGPETTKAIQALGVEPVDAVGGPDALRRRFGLLDVEDDELWATTLAAVDYLWQTKQYARADAALGRVMSSTPVGGLGDFRRPMVSCSLVAR